MVSSAYVCELWNVHELSSQSKHISAEITTVTIVIQVILECEIINNKDHLENAVKTLIFPSKPICFDWFFAWESI